MTARRVVLVGFMGAGKTTVGRALARRLGWHFVDLDRRIAERAGMPIPEIFRSRGEEAFRALEQEVAEEAGREQRVVIAAGGGAFTRDATRQRLQQGALSVWLRCRLETALRRIGDGTGRPLAADREKIGALFAGRQTAYAQADLTFDVEKSDPEALARDIAVAVWESEAGEGE